MKSIVQCSLLVLIFIACKTHQPNKITMLPETVVVFDTSSKNIQNDVIFRVVVSFISRGEGVDRKAAPLLNGFIKQFKEENGVLAAYTISPWGKEGECDNCFSLKNFSSNQQEKFVKGLRELFYGNKLVHIDENQPGRSVK